MTEQTAEQVLSLEDFDSAFETAAVEERQTSENPPDGKYLVKVDKVTEVTPMPGNKIKFSLYLKIASGKQKGRILFKNYNNVENTPERLKYLKTDMAVLGLKVNKLSELNERREELLDKYINVTKKDQKDSDRFYNVYINSLAEAPTEDDEPADDSDLPF